MLARGGALQGLALLVIVGVGLAGVFVIVTGQSIPRYAVDRDGPHH